MSNEKIYLNESKLRDVIMQKVEKLAASEGLSDETKSKIVALALGVALGQGMANFNNNSDTPKANSDKAETKIETSYNNYDRQTQKEIDEMVEELQQIADENYDKYYNDRRYRNIISDALRYGEGVVMSADDQNYEQLKKLYFKVPLDGVMLVRQGNFYYLVKLPEKLRMQENKLYEGVNDDNSYTHYLVNKQTNKIVFSWNYRDLDKESIKYYSRLDMDDMDFNPKEYKILSKRYCIKNGIDPSDDNNWANS